MSTKGGKQCTEDAKLEAKARAVRLQKDLEIVPACRPCNSIKSNKTLEEFRSIQGNKVFYFEEKGL